MIKIRNLSYIYSKGTPFEKKALDNINLEINNNSFVGLIGHTGSGKSTLVQHFNGLLKPDFGEIYINQKNIWAEKSEIYKYRFKVGLVFQYPEHQLFEETVFKDIAFGPKNMGLSLEDIKSRVNWAINIVGLSSEFLNKSPFELSGGQKRKVALAGIISMDPEILILDEPTAGLDPKSKNLLLENIKSYQNKNNKIIILISHNMDDVAQFCDNIILMNQSRIYLTGSVKKVFCQVDKLESVGINVPTVSRIFNLLKNKGYNIKTNITTVDEAVDYLSDFK
ncbi:MAG: energy-coupling factor transporter ATPase [Oscillospiraceae bacterium]|nr:energy-coupling factor transporter ATPase [Oscillospiraceae bacterium]